MASQHPDHGSHPYWHTEAFIRVQDEHKECFLNFSDLGIMEYKWDWEGKLVDESVMERLLGDYFPHFKENPIGKKKFLTFRLPNPKAETEFRLARAFINILSAAGLAKQVGLHSPPFFEVILPMTETAEEMIAIQEAFKEIAELKHILFRFDDLAIENLEIIPLFEQVPTIIRSDEILRKYLALHKKRFGKNPEYLRPYMARSDPALNSGIVPTVVAIKIALSRYKRISKKLGIPLYPIIGSASLPFRGGLTPFNVAEFVDEYAGVKTALLQSAFRYDYKKEDVKKAVGKLNQLLPTSEAREISPIEEKNLIELLPLFENPYQKAIEQLAPLINAIAGKLPKRRERVQHIGLFGYSRGIGKVTLPRAIGFTAALYSVGIPPELIGTGRGIHATQKRGKLALLEKHYKYLKPQLLQAGKFLNKENLEKLTKKYPVLQEVKEDISEIEKYIGEELKPGSLDEKDHHVLTSRIYDEWGKGKPVTELLTKAAILRKSLG